MSAKIIAFNCIYLSKNHAGGKDQVALNLLEGIQENGDASKVVVFCYEYSKDAIGAIAPGVKLVTIPNPKKNSELARLFSISWDNTFVIPKLIKEHDVDIIFHVSCTNGFKGFKIPSVVIPHDIKAVAHRDLGSVKIPFYKYILYRIMYRMDFKHANKIIAISKNDSKEMHQYYPGFKDKVIQIYNPIKVSDIPTPDNPRKKDIVAINLQFHHKNIITLLRAFNKIKDRIDGNLILVGDVPERVNYLKNYVVENGLTDRVIFTGFVGGEEKRRLLVNAAMYVNPSMFEGFGMTAVEAMIMRVPTLLAKIPASFEVTGGLCNYYEPADDANALAKQIENMYKKTISDKELEDLSIRMSECYDYRVIAKKYIKMLEDTAK